MGNPSSGRPTFSKTSTGSECPTHKMAVRREIPFTEIASVQLFEVLIIAGAPATGFFNTIKDAKGMQKTLVRLRQMWQRSDVLFIPSTDLNALHSMHCKSQGVDACVIPTHIASDHRKLTRYYIFLLFRYCMSAAVRDLSFSVCTTTNRSGVQLPDVPQSWLDGRASIMYPSAPPSESVLPPNPQISAPPYCQQPQASAYYDRQAWQHHYNPTSANRDTFAPHQGQREHMYGVAQQRPNPTTNVRFQQTRSDNQVGVTAVGRGFLGHQQPDANELNSDTVRHDRLYPALPPAQRTTIKQAYEPNAYDSNDESE